MIFKRSTEHELSQIMPSQSGVGVAGQIFTRYQVQLAAALLLYIHYDGQALFGPEEAQACFYSKEDVPVRILDDILNDMPRSPCQKPKAEVELLDCQHLVYIFVTADIPLAKAMFEEVKANEVGLWKTTALDVFEAWIKRKSRLVKQYEFSL